MTWIAGVALLATAGAYEVVEVTDGGSIAGVVTTQAAASTGTLPVTQDNSACGDTVPVEEIVVSGGKLANAVVYLDGIAAGAALKKAPAVLDQKQCRYVPHVQAMDKGAVLTTVNSDAVLHNTHSYLGGTRTVFNLALPDQGQRVDSTMRRAGMVTVGCDAGHDWMSAYIHVSEHPYYAVTGADGAFRLEQVPPGTHKLTVWHEKLGTKSVEVTVTAGAEQAAAFEL